MRSLNLFMCISVFMLLSCPISLHADVVPNLTMCLLQFFVAEKFFDKIKLTCLCEKMLAPHIRLSKFRK